MTTTSGKSTESKARATNGKTTGHVASASASSADFYLTDELLTPEERAIRDKVRAFCDREVIPIINDYWERAEFPFELIPKLATLNIAGGSMKGYGCPGMSQIAAGLVALELARGDAQRLHVLRRPFRPGDDRPSRMLGSEEQKQHWLPAMAKMEKIGAFALTEPEHGSDAVALETRARRDGDEYVLDGEKRWIGNASFADVVIVWARDDDGNVGGFLVEKGTPGFETEIMTGKVAKRAVWQADITLNGVRVPAANRLERSRHVPRHLDGADGDALRRRLGGDRPRRRRVRDRAEVRAGARTVRQAARQLPDHPAEAGDDAGERHDDAVALPAAERNFRPRAR